MTSEALQQAQGLLDFGKPDRALELLRAALAGDPTHPGLHLAAGVAQHALGAHAEAEAHARAAAADPELRGDALQLLSLTLATDPKRRREALEAAAAAVEVDPHEWRYRRTLALALLRLGRSGDAFTEAHIAVGLTTDEHDRARALAVLAAVRAAQGDRPAARSTAAEALRNDPTALDLLDVLMRVQLATGQRAEAMSTALAVLRQAPTDRETAGLARIALYLIERRLLGWLLLVAFLVPMLTFGMISSIQGGFGDGTGLVEQTGFRLGCAVALAGALAVIALVLRPLRDAGVRHAVLRFAHRVVRSWLVAAAIAAMLLCYLAGIVLGTFIFPVLTLPLLLLIVTRWLHGFAGWFLRSEV